MVRSKKGRVIVDQARHNLAGLFIFVVTQGEPLKMLIDQLAGVGNHAPAGHVSLIRADVLHKPARHKNHEGNKGEAGHQLHHVVGQRRDRKRADQCADDGRNSQLGAH